jgi:hypothetical protein
MTDPWTKPLIAVNQHSFFSLFSALHFHTKTNSALQKILLSDWVSFLHVINNDAHNSGTMCWIDFKSSESEERANETYYQSIQEAD